MSIAMSCFAATDVPRMRRRLSYVKATVRILDPDAPSEALSAPFGPHSAALASFEKGAGNTEATREAVLTVSYAPTEATLLRLCADVAKVSHMLTLNGDMFALELLAKHNGSLQSSLESILWGAIPHIAWQQATVPSV